MEMCIFDPRSTEPEKQCLSALHGLQMQAAVRLTPPWLEHAYIVAHVAFGLVELLCNDTKAEGPLNIYVSYP